MPQIFETNSPAETKRLGQLLARRLKAGDIVLLSGELGAGKTCLAQGIGKGLRVAEAVKSSSFVLVNEYNGRLKVYHADLFRLNDPGEIIELALEELAADGVLLIEWPDRAWREMAPERLLVSFEVLEGNGRRITLDPEGQRYQTLVAGMTAPAASAPRTALEGASGRA